MRMWWDWWPYALTLPVVWWIDGFWWFVFASACIAVGVVVGPLLDSWERAWRRQHRA